MQSADQTPGIKCRSILPLRGRLLLCASMVEPGARVADVGADHGYLGIWLLRNGTASFVTAAELRRQPLKKAQENAGLFGVSDKMAFLLSDGLHALSPDAADTIICAGMGGDLIVRILSECRWIRNEKYTLILQPQSGGQDLRRWLAENGFFAQKEELVKDSGFLYSVMRVRYDGVKRTLSPGEQYAPQVLLRSGRHTAEYLRRIERSLASTLDGLSRGTAVPEDKLRYYRQAHSEILERIQNYVNYSTDL